MSNFFRDSSLGFKPRSNIFSKLRAKDPSKHNYDGTVQDEEGNSSMMNYMFSDADDSTQTIEQTNITENNDLLQEKDNNNNVSSGKSNRIDTSTPRPLKKNKNKSSQTDEDDFEITEIRNINGINSEEQNDLPKNEQVLKSLITEDSTNSRNQMEDTSSNDVLLEAFTNTQKICSNLKTELHNTQTENGKLKLQLRNFEVETRKIHEKVDKYKSLVNNLQEKSTTLFKKKDLNNLEIQELKKNQIDLQGKVNTYKEGLVTLRSSLNDIQKIKTSLDSELMKKTKELEFITRELDDCSGQLSEEKMKNSSLLEEIVKTREKVLECVDNNFKHIGTENIKLLKDIEINLIEKFKTEVNIIGNTQNNTLIDTWNSSIENLDKKYLPHNTLTI